MRRRPNTFFHDRISSFHFSISGFQKPFFDASSKHKNEKSRNLKSCFQFWGPTSMQQSQRSLLSWENKHNKKHPSTSIWIAWLLLFFCSLGSASRCAFPPKPPTTTLMKMRKKRGCFLSSVLQWLRLPTNPNRHSLKRWTLVPIVKKVVEGVDEQYGTTQYVCESSSYWSYILVEL